VLASVQQSLRQNTFAKIECPYPKYNEANFRQSDGETSATFHVDTVRHQAAAAIGVRF
jgi:hypothetical protein